VLVVGPSDLFMSYIHRVLPSLGETTVSLRALGEVVDGIRATRHDPPAAAVVKGSARMRPVLARAARDAVPGRPNDFRGFWRDEVLRLEPRDLSSLRRQLLGGGQRRNRAAGKVEQVVLDLLWSRVRGERALDCGRGDFVSDLGGDGPVGEFVRAWWPELDATEVWTWLHDPERLRRYARGDVQPAEVEALLASWTRRDGDVPAPSIEDVPLLDELRYLLGDPPPEAPPTDDDGPRQQLSFERDAAEQRRGRTTRATEDDGYAHVLVDEAQDLSPMQWRMLGRRGRYASWTVVGDPAQSSWSQPVEAARARAEALTAKDEHAFRLSTNYRNSAEVFALAARVAQRAVTHPDLPDAVRRTGHEPVHRLVEPAERAPVLRDVVETVVGEVEGTVAVVAPRARRDEVAEQLADVTAADSRVRVLEPLDTKGLEFDAVVVVEADEMIAESEAGWRTLYVVLSRATLRLATVGTSRRWLDLLVG